MNVLLVDPPNHCLRSPGAPVQVHPLGIGYVAAALAPRHEVSQLVPDVRDFEGADPWGVVLDEIERQAPGVVGISAVTATFGAARRLAALVRARLGPEVALVMGGVHPTFRPEEAFAEPAVDFVVRGEGEATLRELCDALDGRAEVGGIAGLWRRDPAEDARLLKGPERPPQADLDALPFPDRDGVLWTEHLQPAFYQSIITLRGCPYKCIYCAIPASADRKTRYRSAEDVTDEIALLISRYRVPYLFFHDSVFTLNRKRTTRLLERMLERGLHVPFACQTRTDRVDPELLALMKAAGCHQVFFGIESGDVESLTRIRKRVPLDGIRAAVTGVKRLGIRCTGFFMIGFPWETSDHIRRTADFATDIGLDAVSLFSATPLPGTELWDSMDNPGASLPDSIDFRAPQVNLTRMPAEEYAALFRDVAGVIDRYNQSQMLSQAQRHWPRG